MSRSCGTRLSVIAVGALCGVGPGCGMEPGADPELSSEAVSVRAFLNVVPPGVACVRVTHVLDVTTNRKNFPVKGGAVGVTLDLGRLEPGEHTVTAVAGPSTCPSGNLPVVTWSTVYPTVVEVAHSTQPIELVLWLSPLANVEGGLDFQPVVAALAMTSYGTLALLDSGEIYHWGQGVSATPVLHSGFNGAYTQIAVGSAHECALATDGTVWCRGNNGEGQVGVGSGTVYVDEAVQVAIPGPNPVVEIDAKAESTCVRTSAHRMYCFGDNSYGQLGIEPVGASTNLYTPTAPQGTESKEVRDIAMGLTHTCFRTALREVECAGRNNVGQLGKGVTYDYDADFDDTFDLFGVEALWSGSDSTCARQANGTVQCWGESLGIAPGNAQPTAVPMLANAVALAIRDYFHGCAVFEGEPPLCWAGGATSWSGVRGDGESTDGWGTVIGMGDGKDVAMPREYLGVAAVCALDTEGVAFCWGNNDRSHLGSPDPDLEYFPRRVLFP